MKNLLRHLSAFVAPASVCAVIPFLIVEFERRFFGHPAGAPAFGLLIVGLVIFISGLTLFVAAVRMFVLIGKGTIMPWDPTRNLITGSLYGHVRNPMILSLMIILVGEAILFVSYGITLWALLNLVINNVYFIFSEEPGLSKRFGEEYVEYKRNVPRWIPRLKPWQPTSHQLGDK